MFWSKIMTILKKMNNEVNMLHVEKKVKIDENVNAYQEFDVLSQNSEKYNKMS